MGDPATDAGSVTLPTTDPTGPAFTTPLGQPQQPAQGGLLGGAQPMPPSQFGPPTSPIAPHINILPMGAPNQHPQGIIGPLPGVQPRQNISFSQPRWGSDNPVHFKIPHPSPQVAYGNDPGNPSSPAGKGLNPLTVGPSPAINRPDVPPSPALPPPAPSNNTPGSPTAPANMAPANVAQNDPNAARMATIKQAIEEAAAAQKQLAPNPMGLLDVAKLEQQLKQQGIQYPVRKTTTQKSIAKLTLPKGFQPMDV